MKKGFFQLIILLFIFHNVNAQTKPDTLAKVHDPAELGDMHKLLANYVGEWNLEISTWTDPAAKPLIVQTTSSHTLRLGGHFLELRQKGMRAGREYETVTTIGFNTTSNQMEVTTISNENTAMLFLRGKWKKTTLTAQLKGQLSRKGQTPVSIRQDFIFSEDNKTLIIQQFDDAAQENAVKTIQYKFTRKK